MRRKVSRILRILWCAGSGLAMLILIAGPAAANPAVIKFAPKMTVQSLAGRPDTDLIEFKNGSRVSVGKLRRLDAAAKVMRAPKIDRMPAALKIKPAPTGTRIHQPADLAAALRRNNLQETVQLPNGRTATVAQIRYLQPLIEKKIGRKLDVALTRPNLSGPAVKMEAETPWRDILKQPDNTVLESPQGKRITVGELKQYLTIQGKAKPGTGTPVSATPLSEGKKGVWP